MRKLIVAVQALMRYDIRLADAVEMLRQSDSIVAYFRALDVLNELYQGLATLRKVFSLLGTYLEFSWKFPSFLRSE